MITSGTQIAKYFAKFIITHFFSACHKAITLQAEPIGEPAQPIEVQEFSHQAKANQALEAKSQVSLKDSKVETIAIL